MIPRFERTLREWYKDLEALPPLPTPVLPGLTPEQAVLEGQQKYTNIRVPTLAIYAIPKDLPPFAHDRAARRAAEARQLASDGAQAKAFKRGVPSARVVQLSHASHFVFLSNEAEVLREMRTFLEELKKR